MRKIFQISYLLLFIIMSFGVAGNIDSGVKTPTINSIFYGFVLFLTVGKITYWIIKGKI